MRYVMLGAPGSGKGTQAQRLSEILGIPAISTGEMLRRAVEAGSELGSRVEAIMNSGALVDDDTMAAVIRERLGEEDAVGGFLLDGYPRTRAQAELLDSILENLEVAIDSVIFIDVPPEELMRRALARQRDDDTEEVVQHRLEVYRDKTEPLVDIYRRRGLLMEIDGHQPIEDVSGAILDALGVDQTVVVAESAEAEGVEVEGEVG